MKQAIIFQFILILSSLYLSHSTLTLSTAVANVTTLDFSQGPITVEFTFDLVSSSPISFFHSGLYDPSESSIFGGGWGIQEQEYTKTSDTDYTYSFTHTFNQYRGDGSYKLKGIKFENYEEETVEYTDTAGEIVLTGSNSLPSTQPTISNVVLSEATIDAPGSYYLEITIDSDVPPYFMQYSLKGPDGNIISGGGHGIENQVTLVEGSTTQYTYILGNFTAKNCHPEGTYQFENLIVANMGNKQSAAYATQSIQINTPTCDRSSPAINVQEVLFSQNYIHGEGIMEANIIATSSSPITMLYSSLNSPTDKNIYGGGGSINPPEFSTAIDIDISEYDQPSDTTTNSTRSFTDVYVLKSFVAKINPYMPRGAYTLKNLKIQNEEYLITDAYADLQFTVYDPLPPNVRLLAEIDTQDPNWQENLLEDINQEVKNIDESENPKKSIENIKTPGNLRFLQQKNQENSNKYMITIGVDQNKTIKTLSQQKSLFKNSKVIKSIEVDSIKLGNQLETEEQEQDGQNQKSLEELEQLYLDQTQKNLDKLYNIKKP